MDRKLIKGESVEENIDSIDLILQAWAPQLGSYIVGITPPVPIMHYQKMPDSDGTIFGGILPFDGRISGAFFNVGKFNKKPLYLKIRVLCDGVQSGVTIECERAFNVHRSDFIIKAGSIIRVALEPTDGAEELYIGMLLHPSLEHADRERQLRNGLKLLGGHANA